MSPGLAVACRHVTRLPISGHVTAVTYRLCLQVHPRFGNNYLKLVWNNFRCKIYLGELEGETCDGQKRTTTAAVVVLIVATAVYMYIRSPSCRVSSSVPTILQIRYCMELCTGMYKVCDKRAATYFTPRACCCYTYPSMIITMMMMMMFSHSWY